MTKAEIIDSVCTHVGGYTRKEGAEIVEALFDTLKETLVAGDRIMISGFGIFTVRDKRERRGQNPRTLEPMTLPARRVVRFRPSPAIRQRETVRPDMDPSGTSVDGHGTLEGNVGMGARRGL